MPNKKHHIKLTSEEHAQLEAVARIVQIACSEALEGASRWTLKMISERLVELEIVESIAKETVRP